MKKDLRILISSFIITILFLTFPVHNLKAYCVPGYYSGPLYGYDINGVELNTISNFTGAGSEYNDYTDISTILIPGLSYTLTIYNEPSAYQYVNAWIDYDQDGILETTEKLSASDIYMYPGYNAVINFTVDPAAVSGETRLRIRSADYAWPSISPCATTYYYGETEDYTIIIPNETDYDAGVTGFPSLATACGLGLTPVTVNITNIGTETISTFDVVYQVTDPLLGLLPAVTEAYTGSPITSYGTSSYTFTTMADFSNTGDYTVMGYTILAGDTVPMDDTSYITFTSIPVISTYPYIEDFEDGASSWETYGTNNSWELGSPTGPVITGAPPATPSSVKSWATSLSGYYNAYETSYVESPCLDFSSLILPFITFDIWWETYDYNDGAQLEYSLDAGATWTLLGDIGTGDNWYTEYGYALGYDPVTFSYENGWVGASGGWKTAFQDISFLAGEPQVKFRFKFASQYTFPPYHDGIAFDNINIQDPYPDDIGVTALVAPTSAVTLSAAEPVTVTVENFGTNTQSGFTVYYQMNMGPVQSAIYGGSLAAGATGNFTFPTTEDLSVDGIYNFNAWTSLPGDFDITNDSINQTVLNLAPISGTAAYYIHLSGVDPFASTDNQDKMDEVFGDAGWTEEFFDTMDPTTVFNESTCFVYIDGGEYTTNEFKTFLDNNISLLENWVSSGGNLLLNAAPYEGGNVDLGFGGVTLNYPTYIYNASATDATFPIFTGPNIPVGTYWYGWSYNFANAKITGSGLTHLINDTWTPSNYALSLKDWGDGEVMFGGMTPAEYHSPFTEASNLKLNIFEFMKFCTPVDLGVVELLSPEGNCGLDSLETISVSVENFGPTTVSSFSIKYQLDASPVVSELATITVPSGGGTAIYTFDAPADFYALGIHNLKVWTDIYVDEDFTNDTLYLTINNLEAPIVDLGSDQTVCDSVTLDAANPGDTYLWNTGETTQTITPTTPGTYYVAVTLPATGCVKSDTVTINLNYTPDASFTYSTSGLDVTFTNTSTPGAIYTWYFGDGTYTNDFSPTHTFTAGMYTVALVAENYCGSSYYSIVIPVGVTGINDEVLSNRTVVYPNPTSGNFILDMNYDKSYDISYQLINELGQIVSSNSIGNIQNEKYKIDISNLAPGVYQLRINASNQIFTKQITLIK